MRRGRHRPDHRPSLPKCDVCGKAAYPSASAAGRDRKRFNLTRVYECNGTHHTTSQAERVHKPHHPSQATRHHRSHTVSTTCPRRPRDIHDGTVCAHPAHWSDHDPNRPYFPDVVVDPRSLAGLDSFLVMGVVSSALTRDGEQPRGVVNTFREEFRRAGSDADDALRVIMAWVTLHDGGE